MLAHCRRFPAACPGTIIAFNSIGKSQPDETDKVLMRYAGSTHAALLERSVSSQDLTGHVIVTTTPLPDLADPKNDWNDLFGSDAWPAFLLVRNIVERLTNRGAENCMSVVGQPQIIQLPATPDSEDRRIPNRDGCNCFRRVTPLRCRSTFRWASPGRGR